VDLTDAAWRTSSHSGGQCVEVAAITGNQTGLARLCAIRDSKDPGGTVLAFSPGQWHTFTAAAQAGKFDPA
jgi:hypothetical protein